jgi:hypothetical protein
MRIGSLTPDSLSIERVRKLAISGFVCLSLASVLLMNQPPAFLVQEENLLGALRPDLAYAARTARWLVEEYAFYAGLNNRWQMFGRQSRFNWWYVVEATYGNGAPVRLPLPGQSDRSLWQAALFDFKETKFNLNLYNDPAAREAYARYLARAYPQRDGQRISTITFELYWQGIRPREEASRTAAYLDPVVSSRILQTIRFPS